MKKTHDRFVNYGLNTTFKHINVKHFIYNLKLSFSSHRLNAIDKFCWWPHFILSHVWHRHRISDKFKHRNNDESDSFPLNS